MCVSGHVFHRGSELLLYELFPDALRDPEVAPAVSGGEHRLALSLRDLCIAVHRDLRDSVDHVADIVETNILRELPLAAERLEDPIFPLLDVLPGEVGEDGEQVEVRKFGILGELPSKESCGELQRNVRDSRWHSSSHKVIPAVDEPL